MSCIMIIPTLCVCVCSDSQTMSLKKEAAMCWDQVETLHVAGDRTR